MRGLVVTPEHRIILVNDIPLPEIGPYDALVKNDCCIICNGTDNEIAQGTLSEITDYPVMLGHESAGYVVKLGSRVRNYKLNDLVVRSIVRKNSLYASGWGAFSQYGVVTDHNAMLEDGDPDAALYTIGQMQRVLPKNITPIQASMTITLKEVYSSFQRAHICAEDRLLIVGDGPVGLTMVMIARLIGISEIYMLGQNPNTLPTALTLGATAVYRDDIPEEKEALAARCHGNITQYIDTVGFTETTLQGLPYLAKDGMIIVYGLRSSPQISIPVGSMRNWGIRYMQFPIHQKEGAAHETICNAILEDKINPDALITHVLPLEEFNRGFELIARKEAIKVALTMR